MKKSLNYLRTKKLVQKYGALFDDSPVYNGNEIVEMVGGLKEKYFVVATMFGKRAYIVEGDDKILIVWDIGHDWYQIIMEW